MYGYTFDCIDVEVEKKPDEESAGKTIKEQAIEQEKIMRDRDRLILYVVM